MSGRTDNVLPQATYVTLHGAGIEDPLDLAFTALMDSVRDYQDQSGFTGARDSELQWHRLGHMQICTLTQTHNHTSIPPLSFMPFLPPNQQRQSTEGKKIK